MSRFNTQSTRLLRIGKASKELVANWAEGVSLATDFGLSIEQLAAKATAERWKLALEHRKEGKRLQTISAPPYRAIVSRFYYVMYHAMRSACYAFHGGDDYEGHSELLKHLPDDFPQASMWKNKLKNARLSRNRADYDPYPKSSRYWERQARTIQRDAEHLVQEVRTYLRSRGCIG